MTPAFPRRHGWRRAKRRDAPARPKSRRRPAFVATLVPAWYHISVHRIRLLTLGMVIAAFAGIILAGFWNFILGIIIAAAIFAGFALAAFLSSGPGWFDDDDRHSWH